MKDEMVDGGHAPKRLVSASAAQAAHGEEALIPERLGNSRPNKLAANTAVYLGMLASVTLTLLLLLADSPRVLTGIFILLLVFSLLVVGIPIGVAMVGASALGLIALVGIGGMATGLEDSVFQSASDWTLSVIPMFVLMSMVLSRSGLASKAFMSASKWLGRTPGGLAVGTNFTGAALAAASGSSIAISYAMGRVGIPEMIRAGYRNSLATASVAMAGTLGQILPPSILLVVYAGVVQTPVGLQLIAGIVPGIILAAAYSIYISTRATLQPDFAPRSSLRFSLAEKLKSTTLVLPVAIVILVVIGGIFSGWLTATEAGAIGAVIALILGWISRGRGHRRLRDMGRYLKDPIIETVVTTAAIFVLIIGVSLLTRALALSRIPATITEFLLGIDLSVYAFLGVLMVLYLVLGMFLDPLAMMLLTVPILIEPVQAMGISPIWFGIFVIIMAEVGQVSPPIGMLSFIVHKIAQSPDVNLGQQISLSSVFIGLLPFIGVSLLVLMVLIVWPDIVTWLPDLSQAR